MIFRLVIIIPSHERGKTGGVNPMKINQGNTVEIPLEKILSETDRKYGGEGDIESLARSIEEHGLINPIAVKEVEPGTGFEDGMFRVIAGRRRVAAARLLNLDTIEATVYAFEADEEAIALAENVNRQEMSPLDEAVTFKKLLDGGMPIGKIAQQYARSKAGIYKRIRLCNLTEDLKAMFRDGKINLSSAAIIASLPEEDQKKFFKKYGKKEGGEVSQYNVQQFIYTTQRCKLSCIADDECKVCKKRTDNTNPSLFDEDESSAGMDDVCLDSECYCKKWHAVIEAGINTVLEECEPPEDKIIFHWCVPKFWPPKTEKMTIGGKEYALLKSNDYYTTNDLKKKKDTAWEVRISGNEGITVHRVSLREQQSYQTPQKDMVKEYNLNVLEEYQSDSDLAKTTAEKLEEVVKSSWKFRKAVNNNVLDKVIYTATHLSTKYDTKKLNLAALYIGTEYLHHDDEDESEERLNQFCGITGYKTLSDIQESEAMNKVFTYLIINDLGTNDVLEINDVESEERFNRYCGGLFWQYSGFTSKEEYIAFYKDCMRTIIRIATTEPETEKTSEGENDE
jgi:ParB/RepB/Spo0J family partition protein